MALVVSPGRLIAQYQPGKLVRITAGLAAGIFLLLWLAMMAGAIWFVLKGEVGPFEALVTSIPMSLVAGGFTWFGLGLARYRIAVFEQGLAYRSRFREEWWDFQDLLDVRTESVTYRNHRQQMVTRYCLALMPKAPGSRPVQIKPLFQPDRSIFKTAAEAWRKSHSR